MELEQRLTDHLQARARMIDVIDKGVEMTIEAGQRKRRRRMVMMAGAASVVAALGVGAVVVVQGGGDDQLHPVGSPSGFGAMPELPPATTTEDGMAWSVEALAIEPDGGRVGRMNWWGGSNGAVPYVLGTAPQAEGAVGQQQLFNTADGLTYEAVGESFDPWITELDGVAGGPVYALGTVPTADGFGFAVGITEDGGATWSQEMLPVDADAIRRETGGFTTMGQDVVVGSGIVLAAVLPYSSNVQPLVIDGVDTTWGTNVTGEGVEVFGPPADMEVLAMELCPAGWPLIEGPPRAVPGDAGAPSTAFIPSDPSQKFWHCESPDGAAADLWVDSRQVHGEVAQVVPIAATGWSEDTLLAMQGRLRVFRRTGGQWNEVDLPGDPTWDSRSFSGASLLWTGDQFILRLPSVEAGSSGLYASRDGLSWTELSAPPGTEAMALSALPNGRLLLTGQYGRELAAFVGDGTSWTGRSLMDVLQLDRAWGIGAGTVVAGPNGVSMLVTAAPSLLQTRPLTVEHGSFTLRLYDSGLELYDRDGVLLDATGPGGQSVAGLLQFDETGGGVIVVDETGRTVERFSGSELGTVWDAYYATPEAQNFATNTGAYWVLDTVDGEHWSIQLLDGVTPSRQQVAAAHSVGGVNVFQFYATGPDSDGVAIVGRR